MFKYPCHEFFIYDLINTTIKLFNNDILLTSNNWITINKPIKSGDRFQFPSHGLQALRNSFVTLGVMVYGLNYTFKWPCGVSTNSWNYFRRAGLKTVRRRCSLIKRGEIITSLMLHYCIGGAFLLPRSNKQNGAIQSARWLIRSAFYSRHLQQSGFMCVCHRITYVLREKGYYVTSRPNDRKWSLQ